MGECPKLKVRIEGLRKLNFHLYNVLYGGLSPGHLHSITVPQCTSSLLLLVCRSLKSSFLFQVVEDESS